MSVKKMVVVPYQVLETMKWWKDKQYQKPILPPNPQAVDASHLLKDMNQILQKTDLSEAEKAQKYGETLFKLQHLLEKTKKPPSTDSPQPTDQPQPPSTVALHDQILQSVPKTMQRKAELLLGMIKNNNNLTWDEQGVVSYKGKRIHGSNIIDLINDTIRQRKGVEPKGWETFSKALHESNIPQEVIGNPSRWKWMQTNTSDVEESNRFTPKSVQKSVRKSLKTPYMRPEERERMKQFYVKELLTPPSTIKKTPSRKIHQSWEAW